ncbi:MAG: DUF1501 domain-containing protein [Pirellulales bacterium]
MAATGVGMLAAGRHVAGAAGSEPAQPRGTAEHVIMLWMGGGQSQVDTWDQKRVTKDGRKDPGSAYPGIPTAIAGVEICEHLPRMAPRLDRCVPMRSVHHEVIDEHGAAAYRMHVGRPVSGTVIYPCLASIVSALKGPGSDLMPSYVLMGQPSAGRNPGFLGAEHGPLVVTSTTAGPRGLVRPARISDERAARRMAMLRDAEDRFLEKSGADPRVAGDIAVARAGFNLAGPEFLGSFDLEREPAALRESYGDEFGQRCLLARRLVERGCRFVEVSYDLNFKNGTGWDTHNEGQQGQHFLIQSLDQAMAALIDDLEEKHLLDKTLIVVSGEFGRPSSFDSQGGRGHQGKAFSVVLAGGGLKTGQAIGTTDELCAEIVDRPVSVPDLFATVLAATGCDPNETLYAGDRPVPATDRGVPVAELFS